jgi:hypothetical protein
MDRKFKNKTKIKRVNHDGKNPYTCITNRLIQDNQLNATEVGMMLMLLSNSDSYILNSTYFIQQTGLGNTQYNNCWKHLIELGYINKRKIQGGYEWIINESPHPLQSIFTPDEFTPCEIIPDENTPDENEALISTNETSINETTINVLNNNEKIENNTRDTSTSIFSGIYTGTSILGHEVEEIINKVLTTKGNAPDKIQIFYFKLYVKNMLGNKVEATGCFEGGVSPYIVKRELNSLKERLDPEHFKSIEPLLQEYIKCFY